MRNIFLTLISLFAWAISASGSSFSFRHLSTADGLSNNEVKAIVKDADGFLWIGTASGLNRYDGLHVRQYLAQTGRQGALPDDDITALQLTGKGVLTVFTRVGAATYQPDKDRFQSSKAVRQAAKTEMIFRSRAGVIYHYSTRGNMLQGPDLIAVGASNNCVQDVAEDEQERLWIATDHEGLFIYTPATKALANLRHDPQHPSTIQEDCYGKAKVYLHIHFFDSKVADGGYGQENYILTMNSPTVFGDDKDHVFKWYLKEEGDRFLHNVYRYERDGVTIPLETITHSYMGWTNDLDLSSFYYIVKIQR